MQTKHEIMVIVARAIRNKNKAKVIESKVNINNEISKIERKNR